MTRGVLCLPKGLDTSINGVLDTNAARCPTNPQEERNHASTASATTNALRVSSLSFAAIFFFTIRLHVLFRGVRLLVTDSAYFASLLHYE